MSEEPTIIEGVVRGSGGEALAGAGVYFVSGPVPLPDIAALSNDDGTFELTAPASGLYRVGARAEGYAPGEVEVSVTRPAAGAVETPGLIVIELEKEQQ